MTKSNSVDLEKFVEEFNRLEKKIVEVYGKNSLLEIMVEDANRLNKFSQTKEKTLSEEKEGLLATIKKLQQTLQEQCNLREENEKLKTDIVDLKQENEKNKEAGEVELQRMESEMRAEETRHQVELEAVRRECSKETQSASREALRQVEAKEEEVKRRLQEKDLDLEEMKKKLKDQEREKQNELLKLQMEFGAKLARVQSSAQWNQQQQQSASLLPQSVFKRKLQFFQEEKNKEVAALRQRIRELEEGQQAGGFGDNRLKRRKC